MNHIERHINRLVKLGFSATANVNFVRDSNKDGFNVLGYEMHPSLRFLIGQVETMIGMNEGDEPFRYEQAYSLDKKYIGSIEDGERLCCARKIAPEPCGTNNDAICNVGLSEDGKWYGWSHRAISGFESRDEAVAFAQSVSSSTLEEAIDGHMMSSESSDGLVSLSLKRKQDPKTYLWFRYAGKTRRKLTSKENETIMLAPNEVYGVKYNPRSKEFLLMINGAFNIAYETPEKNVKLLRKASKPFGGKVNGVKANTHKTDYVSDLVRAKLDKEGTAPKDPKPPKEPKPAPTPEPKPVGGKGKLPSKLSALPLTSFHFLIKEGDSPKFEFTIGTGDDAEEFDSTIEDGDLFLYRTFNGHHILSQVYTQPKFEEYRYILEDDQMVANILSGAKPTRRKVKGKASKYKPSETNAILKGFATEENKVKTEQVLTEQYMETEPEVQAPVTGQITKEEDKLLRSARANGDQVYFSTMITSVNNNSARIIFSDESNEDSIARIKKFVNELAGDTIRSGTLDKTHSIYLRYLSKGEPKAGLKVGAHVPKAIIRDAKSMSSDVPTGIKMLREDDIVIDPYKAEYIQRDIEPAVRGNDRRVLHQIADAIKKSSAYTAGFIPKNITTKKGGGMPVLLLEARKANNYYKQEGEQAIRRIRDQYRGSDNSSVDDAAKIAYIGGRLFVSKKTGKLIMVLSVDPNTTMTKEQIKRARAMRKLLTEEREVEIVLYEGNEDEIVKEDESADRYIEKADSGKLVDDEGKSTVNMGGGETTRIRKTRKVKMSMNALQKGVYMIKEGKEEHQVRVVSLNYRKAVFIVRPISKGFHNFNRRIEADHLYDLGGNKLV